MVKRIISTWDQISNQMKPESYLKYYDVNNLYGYVMGQHLPYGGFEWVTNHNDFDINTPDDSPHGYILEVDLECPRHLHKEHKDFPLAPEHMCPPGAKIPKLMTTLLPKTNYVLDYRNLKTYLNLGLKLKKIHRISKSKQIHRFEYKVENTIKK